MMWIWLACTAAAPEDTAAQHTGSEAIKRFSFAIIADPHVTTNDDHDLRLQAAVEATNARIESDGIELVFVLGDIAWGDGYSLAHAALDALAVPWIPVLGDNPIQVGEEDHFATTFDPQFDELAAEFSSWVRAPVPVYNPEHDTDSWLQNAWLDHGGVRFVTVDWNSREMGIIGEMPDLHDFSGGTLPFLADALDTLPDGPDKRVVLLSHMAPFPAAGGLTLEEQDTLFALLQPHTDAVWGNHAGHLHFNSDLYWEALDFEIMTTDATWDDVNTVRIVDVLSNERSFFYQDRFIELK